MQLQILHLSSQFLNIKAGKNAADYINKINNNIVTLEPEPWKCLFCEIKCCCELTAWCQQNPDAVQKVID